MPDTYVLDNSVVVMGFLPDEDGHEPARAFRELLLTGEIAGIAPRNIVYEFYGVMTHAFRARGKSIDDLHKALAAFRRLPIELVETENVLRRAAELSHRFVKSFYDMCYFAVGELESARVCTADEKSVAGLGSNFPCEYVLLSDFFESR